METLLFIENLDRELYDTVFDGKWTIDYMKEAIRDCAQDLDGDSKWTTADKYGFLNSKETSGNFMYSAGISATTPDKDGYPVISLNTPNMADLVAKYYDLVHSPDTYSIDWYTIASYPTSDYRSMILSGNVFMASLDIGSLYRYLREIKYDFGILPAPKLNDEQENYRTFVGAGILGVPCNASNTERTGAVAEALSYYSYKYVRPAFFDKVLEGKAVRDEDSYKVLQLMQDTKVFDFGFNYDPSVTAYSFLQNVVYLGQGTDYMSAYKSVENKLKQTYQNIIDACKN